ncbi:hypothetical protein SBBP1_850003 [Burkholderiales bacterium]|nr:hypothetical protein SBBP1_850003 [Burkholderiales bacterium]
MRRKSAPWLGWRRPCSADRPLHLPVQARAPGAVDVGLVLAVMARAHRRVGPARSSPGILRHLVGPVRVPSLRVRMLWLGRRILRSVLVCISLFFDDFDYPYGYP